MKKIIINGFAVTIFAVMLSSASFAQNGMVSYASPASPGKVHSTTGTKVADPSASVNTRVARSFYKNFRGVENVQWKETETEYIARFTAGDRFVMAWFNKSGDLYSTNFYGPVKYLPATEMQLIHDNFNGYKVTAATEVIVRNSNAWVVTLESLDEVKKVKLAEGGLEVMETMKRAK